MQSLRQKYKIRNNIFSAIVFVLLSYVMLLTAGFSSLANELKITTMATVRIQKDIRVTNISTASTTSSAYTNWIDYNVDSISTSLTLPNRSSTITYDVSIINTGNIEMGILSITGLPSNLTYSISNYNLKDPLCDDSNSNQCKLGITKTLHITISYKNDGYNSSNTTYNASMKFDFQRIFDITYVGFSGNTSGLPNKMIDGENKTITFNNTTGIPTKVVVTGALGNYSNSPNLVLSNVTIQNTTDTIVVTRAFSISYIDFSGNTSGLLSTITATGGTVTFDNTAGIPTSVTVTGATGNYSSPTLTITNVTDNVTVTATYGGQTVDPYVYTVNVGQYILHGNTIPNSITIYNTPEAARAAFNNRPFYFKHLLVNDIVTESYLEFVITSEMVAANPDMTAGTYALRGGINESESNNKPTFEANIDVLKEAFGEDSWYCSLDSTSIVSCNPPSPGYYVEVYSTGSVGVYYDMYCAVDHDGDSNCG